MSIAKISSIIKPITKTKQTVKRTIDNARMGAECGERLARRQNIGAIKSARLKFIGANRKLPENFWFVLVGACSPVPFGTYMGIGLGKLFHYIKRNIK